MSCSEVREFLSDWLDGELEPKAADSVKAHLERCPACGQAERSLRNVKLLVQAKAERGDPSEEFRDRVRLAIAGERDRPPSRAFWARSPWLRAAAVIVVLATAFVTYSVMVDREPAQIAHATVAEESLARHLDRGPSGVAEPEWRFETVEEANRVITRELGCEASIPLRCQKLTFRGASPVRYGDVPGVRLFCEFEGQPFSIFALGAIPAEVRRKKHCCICERRDDRYLVACWAENDLYFSMVGTDVTEGKFLAELLER